MRLIQVWDKKGNFKTTFGSRGSSLGEFMCPTGICVWQLKILISDTNNHRIQVFDSYYNPLYCISTETSFPLHICVSKQGNIILTAYSTVSKKIILYSYLIRGVTS